MLFSKFFKLLLSNFLNLFTPNDVEFVFVFVFIEFVLVFVSIEFVLVQ